MRTLETERLILRPWQDADLAPFCALNADPSVMEFFPAPLTRDESLAYIHKARMALSERGFGKWAVALKSTGAFAGVCGADIVDFHAPLNGQPELGWRLSKEHWGRGYAPEAARAVMQDLFTHHGFDRVIAFTAVQNARSRRVMEKIGMTHAKAEDFDHPKLPDGHMLRRHVVYALSKPASLG